MQHRSPFGFAVSSAARLAFHSAGYVRLYAILMLTSSAIVIDRVFDRYSLPMIQLLLATLLGTAAALLLCIVGIRSLAALLRGRGRVAIGHLTAVPVAAAATIAGFVASSTVALMIIEPKIGLALAQYRAGGKPTDADITIISADPEIVLYRTASFPGLAAPGWSNFVILDRSRHDRELSPSTAADGPTVAGRASSRAPTWPCLSDRISWIGPYSFASSDDACSG